ncbi:MAG: DsbA family protein [Thaumarchaeota archaeon]|nr:DsbA family protein [Nitrososphaerota archaeon]
MTKRNKKLKPSGNPKTKFITLGIIAAVIIGVVSFGIMSPDSFIVGNSLDSHLSLDPENGSPILGSPSAPVTIVEFGDYQCPFCQKWNIQTKPAIVKNFIETGKANLIFVDLAIIGPDSIKAHAGSYCADEQGLYWKYHDYVYANQGHENDGWANSQNLKLLVSGIDGMDTDSFAQCLDSGKYEQRVKDNKKIATNAGARSTPSFVIVGPSGDAIPISGAQPYSVFKKVIEDMLT